MIIAPEIQEAIELRFSAIARQRNQRGERMLSLGLGEPGFPTPEPIVEAAAKAMRDGFTRYSAPAGLVELRELIAAKMRDENGIADAAADRVVVTPGAKQALSLVLMAILKPGDEVINITPCYPSFQPQFLLAEPAVRICDVDMVKDDFSLDWDALARALSPRTKAILLNFPHNPTGRMLSGDEIERLARLLDGSGAVVISDEIYEKLNFSGQPHRSLGAHPALAGRVVTLNGFSKAYSMTGWRLGWLHAPKEMVKTILLIQQHVNTNTCTFVQKAACTCFTMDMGFLAAYNAEMRAKARFLADVLTPLQAVRVVEPAGGLFAFVNIGGSGLTSDEFASGLLEAHGVAATPGRAFGRNWDDHLRVSLAAGRSEFEEAITLLGSFVRERIRG